MNIFILNLDPAEAAAAHADQHVGKMLIESCQLLCNAARALGYGYAPYKPTHAKHPCSVWTSASPTNYAWLARLAVALGAEWRHRWLFPERWEHASEVVAARLLGQAQIVVELPQTFAQAMPETYRRTDAVAAYRAYYAAEKRVLAGKPATWTRRPVPEWMCGA